jgi:hypothetical protein
VPKDGIGDPSADIHSLLWVLIKQLFIEVVEGALEEPDCTCEKHDMCFTYMFMTIHP